MSQGFRIEALAATHDRQNFSSGVEPLDRYLRELANQDIKRRVSNCFVALDDADVIAGYYTFAATSLPLMELPADLTKRLPRYPLLPAGLIGRLAIDGRFQRCGLGGALIMDAAARAARADPAIYALIVDAKDDPAIAFYEHCQFRRFATRPQSLFLPLATALQALRARGGGRG
uniref:GCN5-related N-acetyltransferase n=1 Tax=Rhodopseudomonas palustris (strain BisA53) TaxID=316055 RepID=Q07RT0_RHOP5